LAIKKKTQKTNELNFIDFTNENEWCMIIKKKKKKIKTNQSRFVLIKNQIN